MTRRLLATLSSIPSTTSASVPPGPFVPPYAHSTAAPRTAPSSLRPPYTHSLPGSGGGPSRINAPYRFSIPTTASSSGVAERQAEEWAHWAQGLIGDDEARVGVMKVWEETLEGLQRAKVDGIQIPEISYSALSEHLSDPTAIEAIKSTGSVIIRDVIPDSLALGWAREIWAAMEQRGGDPVYWHPALLEARSNVSILNTTSSILSDLTGVDGRQTAVLAESSREGLGSDLGGVPGDEQWAMGDIKNIWAVNESGPSTPLLSHLSLSPPSPSPPSIPSSIHTATYSLLRPLFRPIRSRISFYSSAAYLDISNWALLSPADIHTSISRSTTTSIESKNFLPHLNDLPHRTLNLQPGDIFLRHSLLPLSSPSTVSTTGLEAGQAFLPLSLLPATQANRAYFQSEQKAYEAGMPPPLVSARGGIWGERGAVRVEQT